MPPKENLLTRAHWIVNREQVKLTSAEQEAITRRSHQENNIQVTKEWVKCLKGPGLEPATDIKDCLFHSEQLEADEKDHSQWIFQSDELVMWMQEDETTNLEVSPPVPPASVSNPLSFMSALLTKSVQSTQQFPVLGYFCMHRNNESAQERLFGPAALVKSLIVQLIQFIAHHRPTIDLSTLNDDSSHTRLRKANENPKYGLAILKRLLLMLPENETAFAVIDGVSRLSGDIEKGKKLMTKMTRKSSTKWKMLLSGSW